VVLYARVFPMFSGGSSSLRCVICYDAMFAHKGGDDDLVIVKWPFRSFAAMEEIVIHDN